jgi:hypothetical protein
MDFDELTWITKAMTMKDGKLTPAIIVVGSKSPIVSQIPQMPETHGQRMELMRLMGRTIARSGRIGHLEQIFFVSDGWMSRATHLNPTEMRPSRDPDRKEVLIVSGLDIKGKKKHLKLFELVRNPSEQVIDLREVLPRPSMEGEIELAPLEALVQGFELRGFKAQSGVKSSARKG